MWQQLEGQWHSIATVRVSSATLTPSQSTAVLSVAALFAGFGSGVFEEALAVLLMVALAGAAAFILSVTIAAAAFDRLPIAQLTVPVPPTAGWEQVPRVVVTL